MLASRQSLQYEVAIMGSDIYLDLMRLETAANTKKGIVIMKRVVRS